MKIDHAAALRLLKLLAKSALIAAVIVFVGAYIYFCPTVLTMTHGGMLLFPAPPGEEYKFKTVNNVEREEAWFKNEDGLKLNGWFFQNPDKNAPVILLSHGNAGNIGHRLILAKYLMDAGASVFLYDYRSYGMSEGKKDLSGLRKDARAAYDFLVKEKHFPAKKIILYGESIGGGPTCELAKEVEYGGIVLDSTFTSLLRVAKKKVGFFAIYPDFFQPVPPLDNVGTIRAKHAPLLIIHGKLDEIIPLSEGEDNFAEASQPKQMLILPKSTHNWKDPDLNLYIDGLRSFLKTTQSA